MSAPASKQQTQVVKVVDYTAIKAKLSEQLDNLSKQGGRLINPAAQLGAALALVRMPNKTGEAIRKVLARKPDALAAAVFEATRLGLYLHPTARLVYLVPYLGENPYIQVIPDKRGYKLRLAAMGAIIDCDAWVVYEKDYFPRPKRKYSVRGGDESVLEFQEAEGDRGQPIGAIAVAALPNGRFKWLWMSKADIERRRAVSKAKDGDAWKLWWDRMWEKTVMKALLSGEPLNVEAAQWVAQADGGQVIDIEGESIVIPPPEPETEGETDGEPEDEAEATEKSTPATTTEPKQLPPGQQAPTDFRAMAKRDMATIGQRQ